MNGQPGGGLFQPEHLVSEFFTFGHAGLTQSGGTEQSRMPANDSNAGGYTPSVTGSNRPYPVLQPHCSTTWLLALRLKRSWAIAGRVI
jgi:hypothetical protein